MDEDEFYELDSLADVDIDSLLSDTADSDLKFRLRNYVEKCDELNAMVGVFYD